MRIKSDGSFPAFFLQHFGGGVAAELLGGIAGIVRGILALLNLVPMVLLPVGAILFGAVLVSSCGTLMRLNTLACDRARAGSSRKLQIAGEVVSGAAGVQGLLGLAGLILGILAVIGLHTLTLILVAFLCLGEITLTCRRLPKASLLPRCGSARLEPSVVSPICVAKYHLL
jgi:hypothetical protein